MIADYCNTKALENEAKEKILEILQLHERTVIKFTDHNTNAVCTVRNALKVETHIKHLQQIGMFIKRLRRDNIEPIPTIVRLLDLIAVSVHVGVRESANNINLGLNEGYKHGTLHAIVDVGQKKISRKVPT